jgi:hypothetical protein
LVNGEKLTTTCHNLGVVTFYEFLSHIDVHHSTYIKIGLKDYQALCEQGAPYAIPTMCILTIKKDVMLNPLKAKARIVVLGNHNDCVWTKSVKYSQVLQPDMMHLITSMPVEKLCALK